jgi:hypothetical protein
MAGNIVVEIVTLEDPRALGVAADDIEKLSSNLSEADASFRRAARSADLLDIAIARTQQTISRLGADLAHTLASLTDSLATLDLEPATTSVLRLGQSMSATAGLAPRGASAVETFGRAVAGAAADTEVARQSLDAFGRSFDSLFTSTMDTTDAALRAQQGQLLLQRTIDENRGHWETTTEAGLANREAVLAQVRAYDDLRRANIRAGMSAAEADREYDAQLKGLYGLAQAAGAGKKTLDELVGNYFVHVYVDEISNAVAGAAAAAAKTIHAFGFAGGGTTPTDRPYWVGEHGPELRFDAAPGYVMPHAQSMDFARAVTTGTGATSAPPAGTAAASGPAQVELHFSSDGTDLGNLLVHLISKTVRVRGGNAAVLGIRH